MIVDFTEGTAGANGAGPDSPAVVRTFMGTFLRVVEPDAVVIETGKPITTKKAWDQMTTTGDEYGPIGVQTLAEVVQDLISGTTDLPTVEPSVSPDGSLIPDASPSSTPLSLSEDPISAT